MSWSATAPPNTVSYYVGDTNSTDLYNLGYNLGSAVATGLLPQSVTVVLLWGGQEEQSTWGAVSTDNAAFNADSTIKGGSESFGEGFYYGTGSDTSAFLSMAIGTNNNLALSSAAGSDWSGVVNAVENWLDANGPGGFPFSNQIQAYGADDIEAGFCVSSGCPSEMNSWIGSFDNINTPGFYFVGDCNSCPPFGSAYPPYTVADEEYYSWGNASALPIPEIYATGGGNAEEWERMAEYAYAHDKYGAIIFDGSLTQYGACQQKGGCTGTDNTASAGWTQLWDALNTTYNGHTAPTYVHQTPPDSTDIKYEP